MTEHQIILRVITQLLAEVQSSLETVLNAKPAIRYRELAILRAVVRLETAVAELEKLVGKLK